MVHQGAPGDVQFWSIPSGRVESGELVTEGLVREVREETGLEIVDPGRLAFVFQLDNRRAEALVTGRGPAAGYLATVWAFDVGRWHGELSPDDPDNLVSDAAFCTLADAIVHLGKLDWQTATVAYLRGELVPGSFVLERWHEDGAVESIHTIGPWSSRS